MARPPGPLPWLPDKMSGVAPHDLVLLVLWQKTTLKGNSGNHKYLGTKELYGVCCKRIYSSLGGDASVSEGLKQPVFTASHVNPPTTLGQAWRTEPNKHFSTRNANTTTFPNRFQKTGVSSASSWFKNCNRLQRRFTNKISQWPYMGRFWKWFCASWWFDAIICSIKLKPNSYKDRQQACNRYIWVMNRFDFSSFTDKDSSAVDFKGTVWQLGKITCSLSCW